VTARPGLVIGKKGAEIDLLKEELRKLTAKEVWVEVEEIKRPDLDAKIAADGIARQLERRIPFRRAMKKSNAVRDGCRGSRSEGPSVRTSRGSGKLLELEWYKEGSIPLHTLRADIDYATGRAETTYGSHWLQVPGLSSAAEKPRTLTPMLP